MSSITDDTRDVNSSRIETKWRRKKLEAKATADRMAKYHNLRARAARMRECGDIVLMQHCPHCGKTHAFTGNLCRDRLCPLCGWRLSLARYGQMLQVLRLLDGAFRANDIRVSMLTLTLRNCKLTDLHDTLLAMSKAWGLMRRQKLILDLYGWTRSLEITYNAKANTYHPHMHMLLFSIGGSAADDADFTMQAKRAWKTALGIDYEPIIHHVTAYVQERSQAADDADGSTQAAVAVAPSLSWAQQQDALSAAQAAAIEASKYCMGDKLALKIPDSHILPFSLAIKGIRFVGYGGAIKTARSALGLQDDSLEVNHPDRECDICGERMTNYILRWAGAGYIKVSADPHEWAMLTGGRDDD